MSGKVEEIKFEADDQASYVLEMMKFKQNNSTKPVTFRSTIKPIKFPVKVTMTNKVGSWECWFDY